jgi:putative transposase
MARISVPEGRRRVARDFSPWKRSPTTNPKPRRGDVFAEDEMPSTHTNLLYHLGFSTKCRIPLITPNFQEELYRYIGGIIHGEGGIFLEIGGINDHIHILTKFKPSITVSEMTARIKGNSSKWVNEEKLEMRKFGWQEGYGAFSVSESQVPGLTKYIRTQEEHHHKQTFQEEYVALLQKHRIEYDERYLWD